MSHSTMYNEISGQAGKTLNLKGPFPLTMESIEREIQGRSPGNYALGSVEGHVFIVRYIGRSDYDLRSCLADWLGKYPMFKCCYALSPRAAYEKECMNYHDFGENRMLDNLRHPAVVDGKDWKCPVCQLLYCK